MQNWLAYLCRRNYEEINKIEKWRYFSHCYSDKGLKDTVVNLTCDSVHGRSLEITSTVPYYLLLLFCDIFCELYEMVNFFILKLINWLIIVLIFMLWLFSGLLAEFIRKFQIVVMIFISACIYHINFRADITFNIYEYLVHQI